MRTDHLHCTRAGSAVYRIGLQIQSAERVSIFRSEIPNVEIVWEDKTLILRQYKYLLAIFTAAPFALLFPGERVSCTTWYRV